MEKTSYFTDKAKTPVQKDLAAALGDGYPLWEAVCSDVLQKYPLAKAEWSFPGAKYGWNFRLKDKKRNIIYLSPRDKYFIVSLVFGQKAYQAILESEVSDHVKEELKNARVYVEGRGISLEVKTKKPLRDIGKLVEIKLAY